MGEVKKVFSSLHQITAISEVSMHTQIGGQSIESVKHKEDMLWSLKWQLPSVQLLREENVFVSLYKIQTFCSNNAIKGIVFPEL